MNMNNCIQKQHPIRQFHLNQAKLSIMPVYPILRGEPKTYSGKDTRPFLVLLILINHAGKMLSRKQIREVASREYRERSMTDHIIERAVVTAREAGFELETFMASPSGGPNSKYVKYYKFKTNEQPN